jgi:hypothetical protein
MLGNTRFSSLTHLVAIFSLGLTLGCASGEADEETSVAQNLKDQAACHITDVAPQDEVRACDPASTKKTTICHVPPGNPANAHTLCIGTPAVKHHLKNHPDYLGPCKRESTCEPPTGGAGGSTGAGGSEGEGTGGTGAGGAGGTAGTTGAGGTAGTAGTTGAGGVGGGNQVVE